MISEKIYGNPYDKKKLHYATIQQLDDPLYKDQIIPSQLLLDLKKKKDLFVYFYSPECPICKKTTQTVVSISKQLGYKLKLFNILEFPEEKTYNIEGVPVIIYFENGVEKDRIVGKHSYEEYMYWFNIIK